MFNQAQSGPLKGMNPRVTLASMLVVLTSVFLAGTHTDTTGQALFTLREWLTLP